MSNDAARMSKTRTKTNSEIGNREVIGDIDMRIFSGAWRTRENEEKGSGGNSKFWAGRNHSSNLTPTLTITVPSILKDVRAPNS